MNPKVSDETSQAPESGARGLTTSLPTAQTAAPAAAQPPGQPTAPLTAHPTTLPTSLPAALQSARLTVSTDVIAAYAALTDDYNPIHLDPVFAAGTAMGGVIAHGTMSIGLIWRALARSGLVALIEGAALDIRFVKPVRIGETLCAGGVRREAGSPPGYEVWVRCEQDGGDRLSGIVLLPLAEGTR